ncbi:MAG: LptE family protein [Planctomycetota bacterium]|nr:LptE family protein [Planctomycetota bacterium]
MNTDERRSSIVNRQSSIIFVLFVLFVVDTGGCSYATRNALPPRIKSIAVPVFANKTYIGEYTRKLEVEVTEAVRNAFIQAGELKLAGREDADLILEGSVTKLDREILRNDRFGDPAEVRLTVRARMSVYDVKEAKYLLKDQLVTNAEKKEESGVYNLRRGESEAIGRQKAIEDLGRMIARRVTERW